MSYSVVRYFLHLLELSLPGVPIYLPFLAKYMKEVQERFISSTLFFGLYTPQIVFASSSNLFFKRIRVFRLARTNGFFGLHQLGRLSSDNEKASALAVICWGWIVIPLLIGV